MLETYRREDVFVFCCHMTNYHKLRDVNKTTTIGNFIVLCRSEIWVGFPGFSAWHFTGLKSRYHWNRLLSGGSGEESAFKCIQGSWQNPVPCSCNSEVPIPLLSVSQGPLCSYSFSRWTPPPPSWRQQWHVSSFYGFRSLWLSPLPSQPEQTLLLKGSCNWISAPLPLPLWSPFCWNNI